MADIAVVYLSEDRELVEKLVGVLRTQWDVWWDKEIAAANWEEVARGEIQGAKAVVPVLSRHAKGDRTAVLTDEMGHAKKHGKLLFPFIIGDAEMPFGFGRLNRTTASNWDGDSRHQNCRELVSKIASKIPPTKILNRPDVFTVRDKSIRLPAFAFSLSSHETQVKPKDGLQLIQLLQPDASLISAYDYWKHYRQDKDFSRSMKELRRSQSVLYLDSGNYEADRKNDHYSTKKNSKGWRREHFLHAAMAIPADIVFSFDDVGVSGTPIEATKQIITDFRKDDHALRKRDFHLCPIVHLPRAKNGTDPKHAPRMMYDIAKALDPPMLAIPERELGDGLVERVKTVRAIRQRLNDLGIYYPLHLLGTGNPLSMIALAAAGADSFDGLEWCRTVADYDKGYLFHFQHLEMFSAEHLSRIKDQKIRAIVKDDRAPYNARVACFNLDFFNDWIKTMQDMIRAGQVEHLLKMVPRIGSTIFGELQK